MNTSSSQTANNWIVYASQRLNLAGINSARLDSLIILGDFLNLSRVKLLTEAKNIELNTSDLNKLDKILTRRISHEPIAYLRERVEFYGRDFYVNEHVLIPRPESESFIEILKTIPLKPGDLIADIGAGSGCIGITAKLEFPLTSVDLIEKSKTAIKVAKLNAKRLSAKVDIIEANLLGSNKSPYRVILANLPYVPDQLELNQSAMFEPKEAIFAGSDGLLLYKKLIARLRKSDNKPEYFAVESLAYQHGQLTQLVEAVGYKPFKTIGLVQAFKLSSYL